MSLTSIPHRPAASDMDKHWAYTTRAEFLANEDQIKLSYERMLAFVRAWKLSPEDVANCTPHFWDMLRDPILNVDYGVGVLFMCHVNLFLGTVSPLLSSRPDLRPLVEAGLRGEFIGHFLLTEVGRGLDIGAMETTATMTPDGGFILNSPTLSSAKYMPPTTAIPGYSKMAVVFARLIVDGEQRGVHPFLVMLCSAEHGMCTGIRSRRLPNRTGACQLDYAITSFHDLPLPASAFLGSTLNPPPKAQKALLNDYIKRTSVGALVMSVSLSVGVKFLATISADYAMRRKVHAGAKEPTPIISFRTQQLSIMHATAAAFVFEAWLPTAIATYQSTTLSKQSRAGIPVVFKATICRAINWLSPSLTERMGAQGTFGHNLLSQLEMDVRGLSIAEGDILVLCIRLFSETLLGRYALPQPKHADTPLAQHARGIFTRCQDLLKTFKHHREDSFNNLLLPQAELYVTALGHALAYSAALDAGLPEPLLALFECFVIRQDPAWYAEHLGLTDAKFRVKEDEAIRAALPHLPQYIEGLGVRRWVTAPIVEDKRFDEWVGLLKTHVGSESQENVLQMFTKQGAQGEVQARL